MNIKLTTCNTDCFSTATLVARTRLNVTLYVHCLSCSVYMKVFGLGHALVQADMSSRRSVLNPRHLLMVFVVEKMTLGQIFFLALPFSLVTTIPPLLLIYACHWRYIILPTGSIFQRHALKQPHTKGLRSSGMLLGVGRWFVTDVSGQPIALISKMGLKGFPETSVSS
jgi:hypothetical protein